MQIMAAAAILISLYSLIKSHKTMATQEQLAADLTALTAQVAKVGEETKSLLTKVADLEAALSTSGAVSPEVEAALAALKSQVQLVDDLVADAPAAPEAPTE